MKALVGSVERVVSSVSSLAVAVSVLMVEVGVDVAISISLVRTLVTLVTMVTMVPVISIVSAKPMNVDCGGSVRCVNLEQIPG